jgi:predicted Holliday junction resolvase-like endonuclease
MNTLLQTIDGIQEVLGICPCCGEIFRLVEAKFIFPRKRPRTSEYLGLVTLENNIATECEILALAEAEFDEALEEQREQLREKGRKLAKNKLKQIDPTFSGNNINPQDVKALLHPVEYVIFHGLNTSEGVDIVEFVSRSPRNKLQEQIVTSIDATIRNGDVSFESLHMGDDGSFEIRKH